MTQTRRQGPMMALGGLWSMGLFLSVVAWGQEPFRYPEASHGKGELRYYDEIPVLIIRGNPAEMGEQIGVLALKPAAQALQLVDDFVDRPIPANLRPLANTAMQAMYAQFPPEYQQELEAMSRAAGVSQRSLLQANTIIDLQELIGCSSLMVEAERSATGGSIYGRNMDLPYVEGLAAFSLLMVYVPEEGQAFAMPNLPGFLMLASGINDRGLALGSQSVGSPGDGSARFSPQGVASAVAGRKLMEKCVDVNSVKQWLTDNRLARCVSIAACDPTEQVVFEVTTTQVRSRLPRNGVGCATNHFRVEEIAASTDCSRYQRLRELESVRVIDLTAVKEALHAVNQGQLTVHTMVFEPQRLRLHLAMGPGPATGKSYQIIDLAELFQRQ